MIRAALCFLVFLRWVLEAQSFYFDIEIDCNAVGEESYVTFTSEVKGLLFLSARFDDVGNVGETLALNVEAGDRFTFNSTYTSPGKYLMELDATITPTPDPQNSEATYPETSSSIDRWVTVTEHSCEVQGPLPSYVTILDRIDSDTEEEDSTALLSPDSSSFSLEDNRVASASTRAINSDTGPSTGGKVGIAMGSMALLALLALLLLCRRKKRDRSSSEQIISKGDGESVETDIFSEEYDSTEDKDSKLGEIRNRGGDSYNNSDKSRNSFSRCNKLRGGAGQIDYDNMDKKENAVNVHHCKSGCCLECTEKQTPIAFVSTKSAENPHAVMKSIDSDSHIMEKV